MFATILLIHYTTRRLLNPALSLSPTKISILHHSPSVCGIHPHFPTAGGIPPPKPWILGFPRPRRMCGVHGKNHVSQMAEWTPNTIPELSSAPPSRKQRGLIDSGTHTGVRSWQPSRNTEEAIEDSRRVVPRNVAVGSFPES